MLFFRSEEHALRWRREHDLPGAEMMSLDQAWRLASAWYERKLDPDWRRHTLEETEALFGEIGLVGEFWRLRA